MTINDLLFAWVYAGKWTPPNGWKGSGIEYRIMREAGLVIEGRARDNGVGETMAKIADKLRHDYSKEIEATYIWSKSGFKIKAVKDALGIDTRAAHRLTNDGKHLLHGAYLVIESMAYVK